MIRNTSEEPAAFPCPAIGDAVPAAQRFRRGAALKYRGSGQMRALSDGGIFEQPRAWGSRSTGVRVFEASIQPRIWFGFDQLWNESPGQTPSVESPNHT